MNLIERYGYATTKSAALNYRTSGDVLTAEKFEHACLEYRREHGIFEVGDWVVSTLKPDSWWKSKVMKIKHIHKNIFICESVHGDVHQYDVRHATDEEIKANKRLEVG